MHLQINRDLVVPIRTQIVGQIQFGVVSGQFPFGAQLPSIRELALELNVAPMTVTQAYQELKQLGVIEMRPGLGTFVAEFPVQPPKAPAPNGPLQLRRRLRRAVAEAKQAGFGEEEIQQTFLSLLTQPNGIFTDHHLMLVGLFPAALQVYADDLERGLGGNQVVVEPVSFDQLHACPKCYEADLRRAEAILVPVHQVYMLQEFFQANEFAELPPILGLRFALRDSACQAIAGLPADIRIGIVSRFPEFANTMLQGISALHPMRQGVDFCLSTDLDCLRSLCDSVHAIVYASGSEEALDTVRGLLPPGFPLIEFLHTPDGSAYTQIRQLLFMAEANVQP